VTAALYALSGAPLWGLAFFALWFAAPVVAWQSGREQEEERPRLSSEDEFALRRILVATWRYFRMFTRKSTCFLPPDNNQEHPPNGLAMRTSPTNIGIAALAEMMAVTLGYQSVEDTLFRLEGMMTTLEGLEKWEGHLLNWYDIREARPLHPYYVSAVDSGNLACYLILAGQMLDELLDRPRLDRETLSGYLDSAAACLCRDQQWHRQTMESLAEALVDPEGDPGAVIGEFLPDEVADTDAMGRALIEQGRELQALMRLARAYGIKTDALTLRRAAELPDRPEVRGDDAVRAILRQCRGWCVRAATLRSRMKVLTGGMNFAVLYNREKKLFHIGYDIDRDQFSNSFYDLLASEARQTSLFTIASGQVSARHWFRMGRPAAADRNSAILKSWGGTMFEYLLPDQIFRHERGTLLGESIINAVRIQREYCRARGVPWGISESGYYELDQSMNYQYRSFGVPGIGMKSGLGRDLVVSPYSTAMTFHIDALAAWENIRSIIDQGGLGYFGLYEAIDYTSGSSGKPGKGRVVRSYMVHHQGMAMMGIYNYLTRERLKKSMYAIPQISALSILLSERMLTAGKPLDQEKPAGGYRNLSAACYREECPTDRGSIANSINVLSNGNYNVIIGADGTGQSRCGGVAVNRWRSDTEIEYGIFLFVQGHDGSHPPHSVTLRPFLREPDAYHVVHECGQTVFTRRDGCLGTRLAVFVQGNRNAEVRHLRLENHSDAEMLLDVTAYTEIVLNTQQADIAHPPFQNLFIETRWDDEKKMLIAVRRKRLDQDRRYYMAARFVQEADPDAPVSIETIRNAAIGRGHSLKNPHFLTEPWEDGNIEIPVDPVLCMKTPVCIRAGDTVDIALLIGFGEEERDAVAAIAEPGSHDSLEEALELSCCQERALVRYLGVSANQIRFFNRLLPSLILNGPPHPGRLEAIRKNRLGQSGLWGMGLSGDLPIVGVEVTDSAYLRSVFHLVLAHAYWRRKQISYDLIILNRDASDYRQALQDAIMGMILSSVERDLVGKSGGIFILKEEQLSAEQKLLLRAVSVSWFDAEKPLTGQLPQAAPPPPDAGMIPVRQSLRDLTDVTMRPIETVFDNEYGGFDAHSREYVIHCSINTPMPWCMILANREFGTIVSAGGAAFTWLYNSRENKLTPWNGDPVSNPPGQDILVRDEETSAVWRISEGDGRPGHRRTRYGMGYALFESVNQGFYQQQRIIVPPDDTVMIREVSLHNQTGMRRKISVTVWTDFVLGVHRSHTAPHILVEPDAAGDAVYARNGYRDEFADTVAFIAVPGIACQYTSMRNLFHTGYEPATRSPAMRRRNLGNKAGAGGGLGALRFFAELGPGEEKCWTVLLGGAQGAPACRQIIDRYRERGAVELAQARTQAFWDDILERVTVNTPDQGINLMMNGWLLYQAIAARFMARAGFYQTGGAIGFRDQLQDCLAIVWTRPEWVREHILLCAAHQFQSGDVQHWWHPPLRGVKTRISDNMLFLPYVVSEYVLRLDDWELLKEQVPYLEDVEIPEGKEDFYGVATVSGESGTLLDHCLRAVRRACRFGRHGLPLMGAGDWNDAMSSIGDKGRGESVWLGFFLYDVLRRMSYLCERMDDRQTAQELDETARLLRQALNDAGWDGQWYRRAYDDDGNPVGSCVNNDCRIDCISQAWAAISGAGDPDKIEMGLRAMEEQLWCEEGQLLRLLAPPLRDDESELGYIKGYVPGVRENGGQYTHGAVWAVWAYVCVNRGDKAVELMRRLMPYWHAKTAEEARRYMVEPYVSAADVYAVAPHVGRGGWTWYTGSAAWMYKITLEKILGLSVYRNQLSIQPCVSPDWKEYDVTYRWGSATYFIHVKNPYGVGGGVTQTLLDGKPLEKPLFPLVDDASEHHVYVTLGEGAEE
ncbi:MAG: GH36-type glycosyl hydrolase domain-containing protein, partial [Christensenellales bacterium]